MESNRVSHASLRSWRYCVGARLKFWRRSRVPKKRSRDEAVEIGTISGRWSGNEPALLPDQSLLGYARESGGNRAYGCQKLFVRGLGLWRRCVGGRILSHVTCTQDKRLSQGFSTRNDGLESRDMTQNTTFFAQFLRINMWNQRVKLGNNFTRA